MNVYIMVKIIIEDQIVDKINKVVVFRIIG
jgi:hypothetical protein